MATIPFDEMEANWIMQPDPLEVATLVVTICLGAISIIVVALRMWARQTTRTLGLDDYLMIIALHLQNFQLVNQLEHNAVFSHIPNWYSVFKHAEHIQSQLIFSNGLGRLEHGILELADLHLILHQQLNDEHDHRFDPIHRQPECQFVGSPSPITGIHFHLRCGISVFRGDTNPSNHRIPSISPKLKHTLDFVDFLLNDNRHFLPNYATWRCASGETARFCQ